uniref:Hypothetical secreted peptide n=1 Tax=Simulium guianense TaxID=445764 RepID=F5GTP0_SIMGU
MKFFTIVCSIVLAIAFFGATTDASPFFFGTIKNFIDPFLPKFNRTDSGASVQMPSAMRGGMDGGSGSGSGSGSVSANSNGGPNGSASANVQSNNDDYSQGASADSADYSY